MGIFRTNRTFSDRILNEHFQTSYGQTMDIIRYHAYIFIYYMNIFRHHTYIYGHLTDIFRHHMKNFEKRTIHIQKWIFSTTIGHLKTSNDLFQTSNEHFQTTHTHFYKSYGIFLDIARTFTQNLSDIFINF